MAERKDIISKMLTAKDDRGQKLTEAQIISEGGNMIAAGSDTYGHLLVLSSCLVVDSFVIGRPRP